MCTFPQKNSSIKDLDDSFFADDDDDDNTSSDSVLEVNRLFGGGLVAFCFTDCSLNIEGSLRDKTFFFPLTKVVVESSSTQWNSHMYILWFGFFTRKESEPPLLRTCLNTLRYLFLRFSLLGTVIKMNKYSLYFCRKINIFNKTHNSSYQTRQLIFFRTFPCNCWGTSFHFSQSLKFHKLFCVKISMG